MTVEQSHYQNEIRVRQEQESQEILEGIIDKHTLFETLGMIVDICNLKAEHLLTNWQDKASAEVWEKAALHLENCRSKCKAI